MPDLMLVTPAKRPELAERMQKFGAAAWPTFLNHDPVCNRFWGDLYELAPEYQFALLDGADSFVAIGNCIPIRWDGNPAALPPEGIDAVLTDGVDCLRRGEQASAASALMIVIAEEHLGKGLSACCIRTMAAVVARHSLDHLVAPVRPTIKDRYPLTPMERYIRWRRADGLPFDPWIRVHARVGGEIVGTAPAAMHVEGTVADWECWTGMSFPETGAYVVPGGLVPVQIDREDDRGFYTEPGCWIHHRCGDADLPPGVRVED